MVAATGFSLRGHHHPVRGDLAGADVLCRATTEKMKTRDRTRTTTGSTFRPGDSSVYRRSIVLVLPPAPAALVLLGRALAIFSFWSAAARRRMAVRAPPGGGGDEGRPVLAPVLGALTGEEALGEDCRTHRRLAITYTWCADAAELAVAEQSSVAATGAWG
jgi:hypothetical protein